MVLLKGTPESYQNDNHNNMLRCHNDTAYLEINQITSIFQYSVQQNNQVEPRVLPPCDVIMTVTLVTFTSSSDS